ncbi:MAG: prephenate dehydratase domain-containing protein [Hyphomonadaceae bacterium]|nr:prephenate dehydratase domain-containing protein [Hyphomonadaceae bacterium]
MTLRVAYQGETGAFGELTILHRWPNAAEPVPARTFEETLRHVAQNECDLAVLPIWNKTIGDIGEARAALAAQGDALEVIEETDTPVRHALMSVAGANLASIKWVGSHFAALGQCARYLQAHPQFTALQAYDTAGAARELSAFAAHEPGAWFANLGAKPEQLAAIASAHAAERHGLVVLEDGIQDDPQNVTRFAIIRRRGEGS